MVIEGPEATDGAPLGAEAERRTAKKRLSCFARNGAAGVRGRKSRICRCAIGGRGFSRPSARSTHRRGRSMRSNRTETHQRERGDSRAAAKTFATNVSGNDSSTDPTAFFCSETASAMRPRFAGCRLCHERCRGFPWRRSCGACPRAAALRRAERHPDQDRVPTTRDRLLRYA